MTTKQDKIVNVKIDYDKRNDIYYINWGKVKESIELFEGSVVLDIGFDNKIVGIEIFDLNKEINKKNKHNQSRIQTFKKTGCYT